MKLMLILGNTLSQIYYLTRQDKINNRKKKIGKNAKSMKSGIFKRVKNLIKLSI